MAIQSAIIVETAMEIGVTMVELVMALATIIAPIPKTTIMATTLYGLIMWLLPVFWVCVKPLEQPVCMVLLMVNNRNYNRIKL